LTPAVSALEWPGLVHGRKPDCGFPAY
jgi:hypothetical protein